MKAESLYIQKLTYDENTGNEIIGLFPSEANPAIISSYTYDAKRMGGAPTLTATIYSSEPLQWKKEEFVEYNGDRFFASYTPNSKKDNSSRMWKSEITFTSRRELLDNTLFFDVVVDDVDTQNKDRYRSNQTKFTFGGTIYEFVARINSSMAYCGLYRPTDEYKGYYVVVDEGYGTDEVKEVSFEDQYLTDVLQLINTTFELDYYWDGNVCHVGKVQHDLTDTPIKYGSSDALVSVSKENANYKIVDMITGYGSSDNLPYYYPNDDEFGEAVFNTENISKDKVSVELSKFLKDSRYNDNLILYKSKEGKSYNGSVDVSSHTFDRFTTPSNLTQADNQSNPTVTCRFSFSIPISAIKGQSVDLTNLNFISELNSSVSRKDYITNVGNAVKSIYIFKGKELYKTISNKTSFGSVATYTFEEDGDFTLSIESEFSYKCKVYKNSAGINDFYGADSWNAAFSGSIEFLYESKSEYEWKNGDKYIPYSDAGINVSEIGEANCIEYDYQFVKNGDRYGFNKVYTGTEDNAVKVIVTDRVWIAPSSVLMPSIYRNTKGAERFYYALNNTHKLPSGSGYYEFVNLYKKGNPHQGTVTFDGIKPTIKGIVNAEGQLFGEIADVAFDKEDSDVKDSDGNYIHSYFYIKLHKFNGDFGFDLFAHALASESAKINLIKSNGCPACSFVIYNKPSADNSKYYNCVSVDENGNLKQVRTDKNDYIFANASDAYEDNLNQDSTQKELWIAVQKDTSTLGIVMPNASAGFKPQKGDLFVITGIKPPKVLVTAAEKRLDDALVKHMSENNTDQFNYSVKFSRVFLQENPDFASKLNENAKLSIQIQGDSDSDGNLISHEVFVSNYSVKVDNDELAEVEIELVNSLEVTKSDTMQIIDAVKGEAVKSLSSMVSGSNTNSFNASITDKMYLSKLNDDTAKGTVTWEKIQKLLSGLLVGNSNSENGGSWTPDTEGRSHLITDYLEVRMKAIFEELVVKKTSTIGGKEIISPAGGVVAHKVEEVTVTYNNVSQKAYRCYFLAEQDGDEVDNDFAIGDQVRSESFNVRKGTYHKVGNHFYWRLIIGRDEEPVELEGKKYHYIDLSDTDCATASDVPAKGDVLNQCGNRTDVDRQNCLIFSAVDTYSPSVSLYHGINSYSFANKEYVEYGVNKQTNKAFFNVYGDMYVGDRPTKENGYEGSSYIKYDSAAKQVSVKGKISAKSTVDGKVLSQYIKENSAKGLTEEQVNNLIKNSQVIADLQNQVDGAIETWFYEGVPTLKNAPASSWTTDKDKDTHLGDLYYDNKTGKAYRFAKDGSTYQWTAITDTDIAKALSDASKAQETADGKMKVFSAQPTPPYQVGDIWVNATYPSDGSTYKNEILRCQTAKAKGSQFAIADWTKASKYTDDSALNTFKEEYKNDMASYKEQLDEKVETWFYNYAPTTQNKPASDWTTDTLKSQHAGDLFYNTSNGYTYRWTGTAWARIKDNDINTAMTAASKAQDTADGKRTVFTSQPTVPYDEGDLWASGGDDGKTLMVCVKSRTTGSFTSSEWVKANDSDLNAFAKTIENSLNGIQDQLDKKAETWYQSTDPSTSWTTDTAKKEHKGDLWYNTSNNQTFFWNGTKWDKQDVPTEVFDKIDGKSSIYVSKPASYEERDLWILEAAYTLGGVAYSKGELVVATKTNASFSAADWTKKVKYTDDTVANAAKKAAEEAKKAADTAQTNVTNLGETVTTNKKAFDSYVTDGYLEPSEIAAMAQDSKRLEDAFAAAEKSYNEVKGAEVLKSTKQLTDLNAAFATLSTAKTELVNYLSDISSRYNAADTNGKATIVSAVGTKFTNFQSAYSAFYDKLGLANAYITSKIYGDLKQNITDLAGYKYIKDALGQTTDIDGGLVMTTLLALRDADGNVQSGINGAIDTNRGKKSIATWWGGQMVDKDYNSGNLTPATSLVRFDGSGYLANGAIWWDVGGKVHADPTSFIISEKNLGAYLTFFEPTWKAGSAGTSVADLVSLKPNAPFSKLGVSGDATFEGAITFHGIKLTYDATNKAIKIDGNLYATGGITAYGASSGAGGGGLNASVISYARIIEGSYTDADLTSIPNAYAIKALSRRIDNIATELGGLSLSWDNITGKPSTFAPSAHTHKWAEITDRITKVSQLTNDSGYTKNTGTVTSVSLTLPAGLTCATKTITTSGTFAISLASGYSIPTTAKQTAWDSAYDWYALMTTDEETADGIINKWNEVVSFLANIAQTDTLSGIVDGINKSISDEVARAKKAEGVNASGISANKTSITTLQGYFTNGSAKKALQLTNARKLWGNSFNGLGDINGSIIVPSGKYISIGNIKLEYDAANKALKITNTTTEEVANLYTSGGVSAYGAGTSSSSGGGLNGSVKAYADAIKLTTENLSEIASAYSVAKLYSEIKNVASAVPSISVSVPTGGNALTGATYNASTGVITFTKGTFLTAHQSLDGYVNEIATSGTGNAITSVSKSGKKLTFTKGATFLTSHQSLSAYLKSADAANTYLKLSGGAMTGNISYKGSIGTYDMITFVDNNADVYGNGISIGGGGLTIIGGGESANEVLKQHTNGGDENMIVANDAAIDFFSNVQYGWDSRKAGSFDTSGYWNGAGFKKDNSSDSYVLLGGGGHKAISSLSVNYANSAGSANSVAWSNVSGRPTKVSQFTNDSNYATQSWVNGRGFLTSHQDISGKANRNGDYLSIAGSRYWLSNSQFGLNMNNSDIVGINSIITADVSDDPGESILFKRSNGNYDTLRMADGVILFGADYAYNKPINEYEVLHQGNLSISINSMGQLSLTKSSKTDTVLIRSLRAISEDRATTANLNTYFDKGLNRLVFTHATSSTTTGKPSKDSHILHFGWDNNGGYDNQLAILNGSDTTGLEVRGQNAGTWGKWYKAALIKTNQIYGDEKLILNQNTKNTDTGIGVKNGDYELDLMIGSGNVNRGLYDMTHNEWMIYRDNTKNIYMVGNVIATGGLTVKSDVTSSGIGTFKALRVGNVDIKVDNSGNLYIVNKDGKTAANFYATGGITAYGEGSGSSSGGGLNGSVKAYADAIKLTTENLSEIASAYSVAKLYSEIKNVASAVPSISVSVPTGGNALTGATYNASTGVITFTKGTFLTAHQSLDGYVNEIATSGTGNAITSVSKSGKKLTFTKGATFLTSHQSLSAYLKSADAANTYLKLSGGAMTGNISYKGSIGTYDMITFVDNNADVYGNGISIGGGGLTIIGGGESANEVLKQHTNGGDENMIVANDAAIDFFSNVQYGWDSRKAGSFDTSGYWNGAGFKKDNSSDSYVLLGGGGHKAISSLSVNYANSAGSANSVAWSNVSGRPTKVSQFTNDSNYATQSWVNGRGFLTSHQDISGKANRNGDYLSIAGSRYWLSNSQFGLNMNNSDIVGINSIITADVSDDPGESILFKRSNGNYDTLRMADGVILFGADYAYNKPINEYEVLHQGNLSISINSMGQLSLTKSSKTDTVLIRSLRAISEDRATTANLNTYFDKGLNRLVFTHATSSTTTGKPSKDSHILHFGWDNNGGYDNQLAILNGSDTTGLEVRGQNAGTWGKWYKAALIKTNQIYGDEKLILNQNTKNTDTGIGVKNGDYELDLMIGSGNVNRGLYDMTHNEWMIYRDNTKNIYMVGNVIATGGITAYSSSDIRLKQDLRKLDYLGIIKAMGGTYGFAWKKDNTRSIGWIAQHVLCNPHLKDIVETDEKGYYKINYWSPKLIATAFGAIEQVGDEVSRLKARVVFLESEVQRLSGEQDGNNKKRLDNKNINLLN